MLKKSAFLSVVLAGGLAFSLSAGAQGGPPKDNMIDGERYPNGNTPVEIKNGLYPRMYTPGTEKPMPLS